MPRTSDKPRTAEATAIQSQGAQVSPMAAVLGRGPTANSVRKPSKLVLDIQGGRPSPVHYAVDAEMVTVVGPGELPERRAMVSVGVVNDRLETLLYGRVAVPRGCKVTDGAFARVEGELWASWDEGIPVSCVSELLLKHVAAGGVIVGWEIHGDLEVIGFEKAASLVRNGDRENLPSEVVNVDGPSLSTEPRTTARVNPPAPRPPPPPPPLASPPPTREDSPAKISGDDGRCSNTESLTDRSNFNRGTEEAGKSLPGELNVAQGATREADVDGKLQQEASPQERAEEGSLTAEEGESHVEAEERRLLGPTWESEGHGAVGDPGAHRNQGEAAGVEVGMMRVVEVTDLFRTLKGSKCMLSEAHAFCFDRKEGAHNAAVDARMTMELFNLWRRAGEPEQPLGVNLSFFIVNFHSFKRKSRQATMWNMLRPEGAGAGGGRKTVIEKDSEHNTYKLLFRSERERDAYIAAVEIRMAAAGVTWGRTRELVPGKRGATDGYQLSCALFKMHVLELER